MRINNSGIPSIARQASERPKAEKTEKSDDEAASVVSLGAARRMNDVADARQKSVDARIEVVRAELARGDYKIDFDQLASRLLDDDAARGDG